MTVHTLPLTRIIYASRRSPRTLHLAEEALVEEILDVSRPKNAAWQLSGLLVSGGGCFVQTLEGPPDRVATMFVTIRQDPRHQEVTLLHDAPTPARLFAAWTMAYLSDMELIPEAMGAAGDALADALALAMSLRAVARGGPAAFAATPFGTMAQAA